MKICMLSDYSGTLDEGMRNIAFYLSRELSHNSEVLHLCLLPWRNLLLPNFWRRIKDFHPQIIHFIPGPSIRSLIFVKVLKVLFPQAKTVVSATHPFISSFSKKFIRLFKPDLILTQSREKEALFSSAGCETRFLPNGVDTERFVPVSQEEKLRLRQKYQLEEGKFILLHVGSVDKERNTLLFNQLQKIEGVQALIIGSVTLPMEPDVYQSLIDGGCLVWRRYFANIEELYMLSDCYIFPTFNWKKGVVLPLSVLEAMSCNLPVISTPFGGLPQLFTAGDGLSFAISDEEILTQFQGIRVSNFQAKTREKVLPYSWESITKRLEHLYNELINGQLGQ